MKKVKYRYRDRASKTIYQIRSATGGDWRKLHHKISRARLWSKIDGQNSMTLGQY